MGVVWIELYSWVAVAGPSRLCWSGPIKCRTVNRTTSEDFEMLPYQLISTCHDLVGELWIGCWWLEWTVPVCCRAASCHEVLERGQARNFWYLNGQSPRLNSSDTNINREYCREILLSAILQPFRTRSSDPPPPFHKQLIVFYVLYFLVFLAIKRFLFGLTALYFDSLISSSMWPATSSIWLRLRASVIYIYM